MMLYSNNRVRKGTTLITLNILLLISEKFLRQKYEEVLKELVQEGISI